MRHAKVIRSINPFSVSSIATRKIESEKIKRLYIIGINTYSESQKYYYESFFDLLDDDEYVITFSYTGKRKNILNINIANFVPFVTYLLSLFLSYYKLDDKITFILNTCDTMTISGIVMLYSIGGKNIFVSSCPPYIINPSVFDFFKKKYGVRETSYPEADLYYLRQNKK